LLQAGAYLLVGSRLPRLVVDVLGDEPVSVREANPVLAGLRLVVIGELILFEGYKGDEVNVCFIEEF
jgi:hypothetical protein